MADEVVLVADDHPLFRSALTLATIRAAPTARVIEAGSIAAAVAALRDLPRVDLILLDLRMPDAVGFSGVATVHAERPQVPIVVVSAADANEADGARRYGAAGFLNKSASLPEIEAMVAGALAGERLSPGVSAVDPEIDAMAASIACLTPAQLKVLIAMLGGRLNKQIAHDIGISEATVKAHVTVIFRKLGVQNRTQAVVAARALGLDAVDRAA